MSVPNRAASDARKATIPHWAGERVFSGSMGGGTGSFCALAASSDRTGPSVLTGRGRLVSLTSWPPSLLVLPVRILGMFQVPKGTAAVHGRRLVEVVRRRRRCRLPLQRPAVPGVVARRFSVL